MGKPCVTGAGSLHVDYLNRKLIVRATSRELNEGDVLTIDGTRGLVYDEPVMVEPAPASPHVETILAWADQERSARVLAEATTLRHAQIGRSFGADGVLYASDPAQLV